MAELAPEGTLLVPEFKFGKFAAVGAIVDEASKYP